MEGRAVDKNGNSLGDGTFHRVAMGTTTEVEEQLQQDAAEAADDFAEDQFRRFEARSPGLALKAYEQRLAISPPDHPRRAAWEAKIEELRKQLSSK